jgi:dihydrofolate synthase/folylpolyglutamate synthase
MSSERLAAAKARLDALVDWEQRDRRQGMSVGLEPAVDLMARLGEPQTRFRAVHVAGTKGKGTTSAMVASALTSAGIRTGLYTSPHVERVHERIRVDGAEVTDDVLAHALERVFSAREAALRERTPAAESTWFDVLTAAAFLVFAESRCEWAVVECGLGGRLDSTNVVRGEVCVITNIDLEHTNVLGATRALIAREKAGILKLGSTLVTTLAPTPERGADEDPGSVVESIARVLDVPIVRPATETAPSGRARRTMLERNADLARLVLDELGRRGVRGKDGRALDRGRLDATALARARLPARLERMRLRGIPVVLDGAHVASSVSHVLEELSHDSELRGRPVVVLALGRDKDAPAILKTLRSRADRLVCTTAASGPLRATGTLIEEASRVGFVAETAADPTDALDKAARLAEETPGGWVLVIGSFYLAGAVRPLLQVDPPKDP